MPVNLLTDACLSRVRWALVFCAGGGLQRCREELAAAVSDAEVCSALMPVTGDRVLDLVLSNDRSASSRSPLPAGLPQQPILQWVVLTSAVWLVILALISGGFLLQLERQNGTLEVLLERLEPATESSRNRP